MGKRKRWKIEAAKEAAKSVEDDMKVGLGSGTTLAEVVKILGEQDSEAEFVVASENTREVAEDFGLEIIPLRKGLELDITIDGADEIDPNFDMIKGGGGAHTREKVVAGAAEEVNIVVDKTKLVENLCEKNPLPLAVVPFASEYLIEKLEEIGKGAELRKVSGDDLFVTDNGNYIIDMGKSEVENPKEMEKELNVIPGVVENGIFTDLADRVYLGYENGVEVIESEKDFLEIYESL